MPDDWEDPNEIIAGPFEGWIFNDPHTDAIFRPDLHRTRSGVVCYNWQEHHPEVEGHFQTYRRRTVYPTRAKALAGLRRRLAEAHIARIDRQVNAEKDAANGQ